MVRLMIEVSGLRMIIYSIIGRPVGVPDIDERR
jgi:hypothetical protein